MRKADESVTLSNTVIVGLINDYLQIYCQLFGICNTINATIALFTVITNLLRNADVSSTCFCVIDCDYNNKEILIELNDIFLFHFC